MIQATLIIGLLFVIVLQIRLFSLLNRIKNNIADLNNESKNNLSNQETNSNKVVSALDKSNSTLIGKLSKNLTLEDFKEEVVKILKNLDSIKQMQITLKEKQNALKDRQSQLDKDISIIIDEKLSDLKNRTITISVNEFIQTVPHELKKDLSNQISELYAKMVSDFNEDLKNAFKSLEGSYQDLIDESNIKLSIKQSINRSIENLKLPPYWRDQNEYNSFIEELAERIALGIRRRYW